MSCAARPTPTLCCWHEVSRDTYRGGGDSFMLKTERCCFCGRVQGARFELKPAEGHGPHATPVWHMVSTIRGALT